jgi:hypothetical protein
MSVTMLNKIPLFDPPFRLEVWSNVIINFDSLTSLNAAHGLRLRWSRPQRTSRPRFRSSTWYVTVYGFYSICLRPATSLATIFTRLLPVCH